MTLAILEALVAEFEPYRIDDMGYVRTGRGRIIIEPHKDRIYVNKSGERVINGVPLCLEKVGDIPALIVQGERHAWDAGPKRWTGKFAVIAYDSSVDVDGPLPIPSTTDNRMKETVYTVTLDSGESYYTTAAEYAERASREGARVTALTTDEVSAFDVMVGEEAENR